MDEIRKITRLLVWTLCFALIPTYSVITENFTDSVWEIPSAYPAGSPIFIHTLEPADYVAIDGLGMDTDYLEEGWIRYSGAVPLSSGPEVLLWSLRREPGQISAARQTIRVHRKELAHASELRLPAQVREKLGKATPAVRELERQVNAETLNIESDPLDPNECWSFPLQQAHITSRFGSPRTPPSGEPYYHGGVDFRAAPGTPVFAARSGIVRLATEMTLPGRFVVIDHGRSLFSRYLHLQKILVAQGQWVIRGELIGLTGATGRVEAPHLHWEVIWKGVNADPLAFRSQWLSQCRDYFSSEVGESTSRLRSPSISALAGTDLRSNVK